MERQMGEGPEAQTSHRTRFIQHQGESILLLDLSGLQLEDELVRELDTARRIVAEQPAASVRTLTHTAGARINTPVVAGAMRSVAEQNAPHVKAAAFVGVSPQQRVVYDAVMLLTGRKLRAFDDMDTAKDWLVSQTGAPE